MIKSFLRLVPSRWRQRQRLTIMLATLIGICLLLNLVLLEAPLDRSSLQQLAQTAKGKHDHRQQHDVPTLDGVPVILGNGSLSQVILPKQDFQIIRRTLERRRRWQRMAEEEANMTSISMHLNLTPPPAPTDIAAEVPAARGPSISPAALQTQRSMQHAAAALPSSSSSITATAGSKNLRPRSKEGAVGAEQGLLGTMRAWLHLSNNDKGADEQKHGGDGEEEEEEEEQQQQQDPTTMVARDDDLRDPYAEYEDSIEEQLEAAGVANDEDGSRKVTAVEGVTEEEKKKEEDKKEEEGEKEDAKKEEGSEDLLAAAPAPSEQQQQEMKQEEQRFNEQQQQQQQDQQDKETLPPALVQQQDQQAADKVQSDQQPPLPAEEAPKAEIEGSQPQGPVQEVTGEASSSPAVVEVVPPATPAPTVKVVPEPPAGQTCEAFLEQADAYSYSRDYREKPITVERSYDQFTRTDCDLGCNFASGFGTFDASYHSKDKWPGIQYTMESYTNYPYTKLETAKAAGYEIVMTPRLDADVSVVYFGWNSFDPMRPATPAEKKENVLAAFVSNCGAANFRNDVLRLLMAPETELDVHSYGGCMRNQDNGGRRIEKSEIFPKIKFSLAFENSCEQDYVTEKFFQSIDYGAIPVVIGAPNIMDFAPAPNSVLHLKSMEELPAMIDHIKYLMKNDTAYDEMHAYKTEGPTDNFMALVDLGITHPDCRLCIVLADRQRAHEREDKPMDRPCACKDKDKDRVVHHLYIRERGQFKYKSLFLEEPLTVKGMHDKLHALLGPDYKPVWTQERPSYRQKLPDGTWDKTHQPIRIHKIYPAGSTTKDALFSPIPDRFTVVDSPENDEGFRDWVKAHPCGQLEVIFV